MQGNIALNGQGCYVSKPLLQNGTVGRPNLVFPGRRVALFVHGCFWHQHGCCLSHAPASRLEYWGPKLSRNKKRDAGNAAALECAGWTVMQIWECDTRRPEALLESIDKLRAHKASC